MKTWYYKVHTNSHALSYKRILFRDAHYFEMHPHYHFITKTQKEKSSVRWMTPSLFLIPKRYPIEKSLFYSTTLIVVMIYYMVTVCRRQHPFREYIVVVFFFVMHPIMDTHKYSNLWQNTTWTHIVCQSCMQCRHRFPVSQTSNKSIQRNGGIVVVLEIL